MSRLPLNENDPHYLRDEQHVYDDATEIYILGNLFWRIPTTGGPFEESVMTISQKMIKRLNEEDNAPAYAIPLVREICGKCGGDGGEILSDGYFPCYRCCEHGYEYTPLDMYLMEQLHLDALEDNYQRDMRIEESKRAALQRLEGGFLGGIDKAIAVIDRILSPKPEVEDDIPF